MLPTQVDRRTFLKTVQASGLLSDRELKSALKRLPETNRGRVVARALVREGLLTRFQAELLLAGRSSGFLLGPYRILDQIGQGGMGRVYKALHQPMNRIVALKVLAPQHVKTEKARELFRREVLAAGRLMHPNIVTAYDAGCTDGRYFLAMEFVDGPNLDQLVRERGPLPAGLACDIIRQAAYGLQRAHELGMVHRDVKPSNLLVEPGPTAGAPCVVKILDFGLARLHAPSSPRKQGTILTRDNTIMGTPDYLSPEQSRSLHAVDIRSDLYSLGCTFYHTLTGQVPFPGGTTLEKLIRQASEEPTPLERQRPDLPEAVCAVVRKLMAKDPANRFQTPAELAAALAPVAVAGSAEFRLGPGGVAALVDTGTGTPGTLAPDEAAAEEDTEQIAEQALARTLPQDSSPTALSGDELPIPFDDWEQGQRTRNALYWSLGIVAGLVGLVVAAVALGR